MFQIVKFPSSMSGLFKMKHYGDDVTTVVKATSVHISELEGVTRMVNMTYLWVRMFSAEWAERLCFHLIGCYAISDTLQPQVRCLPEKGLQLTVTKRKEVFLLSKQLLCVCGKICIEFSDSRNLRLRLSTRFRLELNVKLCNYCAAAINKPRGFRTSVGALERVFCTRRDFRIPQNITCVWLFVLWVKFDCAFENYDKHWYFAYIFNFHVHICIGCYVTYTCI